MSQKDLENFDIKEMLKELSKKRPIFHNERDLQFEFAWLVKEKYDCDIRHEYYYKTEGKSDEGKRIYIDLIAYTDDYCIAFEFKYKTKAFKGKINDEYYDLKDQSAQNLGSAYILSDLSRTEKLIGEKVNGKVVKKGFVVFLTNDIKYKTGFGEKSIFHDFSLIKENEIKDEIKFNLGGRKIEDTVAEQFKDTEFKYNNTYTVNWENYSEVESDKNNSHVYSLVFEVEEPNANSK